MEYINSKIEIWKALEGFPQIEGAYLISSYGRFIRIDNAPNSKQGIRKPFKFKKGYLGLQYNVHGKKGIIRLNRIVAINFIPNPENKPEVNHIDGNKENNRVDNLQWVTRSENELHKYRVLGRKATTHCYNKGKHLVNGHFI